MPGIIFLLFGNNDEMLKRLDQLNENFKKYADSPPPVNIGDDAISKMDKINTLRKGKAGMN